MAHTFVMQTPFSANNPTGTKSFAIPPWSVLVLCAMVSVLLMVVTRFHDRGDRHRVLATRVLEQKGVSLIHAVEAALYAGIRFRWSDEELDDILERLGKSADLKALAITTEQGEVLASSVPELRNTIMLSAKALSFEPAPNSVHLLREKDAVLVYGRMVVPNARERLQKYRERKGPRRPLDDRLIDRPTRRPAHELDHVSSRGIRANQSLLLVAVYDDASLYEAEALDTERFHGFIFFLLCINGIGLVVFYLLRAQARVREEAQRNIDALQQALRQRDRLATLGSMAAGIAHEIRNPLGAIKGLARYFKEGADPKSEEARLADMMTNEVLRLDKVVGDLLDFTKPCALVRTPITVSNLSERLQWLIESDLKHGKITFIADIPSPFPPLCGDEDKLVQALLNLALNSIQAMPNGGTLTLRALLQEGKAMGQKQDEIWLELADTGGGMDANTLERMLTPYFTTKADGTGLGLPIAHKIFEEHGAAMTVHSEEGQGTIVTVRFYAESR